MLTALASGAMLALVSSAHCAAMCGPLSCAACARGGAAQLGRYQLGRMLAYAFLGAVSGELGQTVGVLVPPGLGIWVFAALTVAACALNLRVLLAKRAAPLVQLRTRSKRSAAMIAAVAKTLPREPLALGLLSGLLPCGVLAGAVLTAAATGTAREGAWLMAAFAAVSGIPVIGSALVASRLSRHASPAVRLALASVLLVSAALAAARPLRAFASAHVEHAVQPHCH